MQKKLYIEFFHTQELHTEIFIHRRAKNLSLKKACAHRPFYARLSPTHMLNLQTLQEASKPRRVWHTKFVVHQCFWGRNPLFCEKLYGTDFFGNFLRTKPIHTCFETQKLSYYGKILVHPPGLFHAQQLWNRNRLKPLFRMSFYSTKIISTIFTFFIKITYGEF